MAESVDPYRGLGLPYGSKTPQVRGREAEIRMAKDRGARPHPMSGAGSIKDDASTDDVQYEFKQAGRTHTLNGAALQGLWLRACRQSKRAEYVIYFEDADITATIEITKGRKP